MTEQRAEDRGAISPRTPLSQGVHSGGVHVSPLRRGSENGGRAWVSRRLSPWGCGRWPRRISPDVHRGDNRGRTRPLPSID